MAWTPIKMEATRACQSAGTWPEARMWRIAQKKRLVKEEKMTTEDANDVSWQLMAEKFCPEVAAKYKGFKNEPRQEKEKVIAAERKVDRAKEKKEAEESGTIQ